MTGIIVAVVVLLLLSNNKTTTGTSTAAQNGPGTNPLANIAQGLLAALTRNTTSPNAAPKASGMGGPGSGGGAFANPTAGKQSRGSTGDQNSDGSFVDAGDGLSGFLSAFPPGTTLGDAITASGQDDFRTGLSDITGIDVGAPAPVTTDIGSVVLADGGIPTIDSTSADGVPSGGDPFSMALGQGSGNPDVNDASGIDSAPADTTDYTNDGGDLGAVDETFTDSTDDSVDF